MKPTLQVWIASPYGERGRGGIDRLNDSIFSSVRDEPDIPVKLERLTTRGHGGLIAAQFIYGWGLLRFAFAALFGNVDVLHIHISGDGSSVRKSILGLLSAFFRVPYVLHYHGSNFSDFYRRVPIWRGVLRSAYGRSARVVVLGAVWRDLIAQYYPEIRDRIVIIPNACRSAAPASASNQDKLRNEARIVFLGKLCPAKGVPELVAALTELSLRNDWSATLAGNGDVEWTRRTVAARGMTNKIQVPGWLDDDKCQALLRDADILVLPSHSENMPMSIIEAFSNGLVVIATPVGAVPEVITDGVDGLLVPVSDVTALRSALERVLDQPDFRVRLGRTARKVHAERYEMGSYVRHLAKLWRDVYEQKTATRGGACAIAPDKLIGPF